jgi:hypothetical protein
MTDPKTMRQAEDDHTAASLGKTQKEFAHALLFTGHMIDRADRREARFPAWAEDRAREAIHAAIAGLQWTQPGTTVGMAGGASGGDLLFHECCEELGIPTRVLLAVPPDEFEATSVAPAGPGWVRRFRKLRERAGGRLHVMKKSDGLMEGATDNVWQGANLWMIEEAERLASERALLALWDGKAGDGPGGTEHFLQVARVRGIRILPPIDMRAVLGTEGQSG